MEQILNLEGVVFLAVLGLLGLAGLVFLLAFWTMIKIFIYQLFFRREIKATLQRDPAATGSLIVILTYPGLHALFYYHIAHFFYRMKFRFLARSLSQWARWRTGIEIHPGALIGRGLFIDHGMGVVIGETAVVGDNVTLFQGATLGGTGKEKGKRHPTLGNGVVVGAGAKVLGNITIGDNVRVGANSVVIMDVPANSTVVGVPGRVKWLEGKRVMDTREMEIDYTHLEDPLNQTLNKIEEEIQKIEDELKDKKSKERM